MASEIEGKIYAALGVERPGTPAAVAEKPEEADAEVAGGRGGGARQGQEGARAQAAGAQGGIARGSVASRRASAYELAVRALSQQGALGGGARDVARAARRRRGGRRGRDRRLDRDRRARRRALRAPLRRGQAGAGGLGRGARFARRCWRAGSPPSTSRRRSPGTPRRSRSSARATCSSAAGARSTPRRTKASALGYLTRRGYPYEIAHEAIRSRSATRPPERLRRRLGAAGGP